MKWLALMFISALAGMTAGYLSGCTPAQQQSAMSATYTGTKIAACVESVLAEEEQARALAHRLAETARELEAEQIRSAVREHPGSVKEEIEKVMRDGGTK
jgi:hypothetical protein